MGITRREMIGALCGGVAGALMTAGSSAISSTQSSSAGYWTAHKLDSQLAAQISYEGFYFQGYGCCYGTFKGIVGQMADTYGAPYNTFPLHMMEVGKSGISDWGTICGALLGAASAWALFWGRNDRDVMVNELYSWYEKSALPLYAPAKSIGPNYDVPKTTSASVLCHVSASKWCHEHGYAMKSKERSERCARLTADVTLRAVEIMNAKIDRVDFSITPKNNTLTHCGKCHGPEKKSDISKGQMDCGGCHSGKLKNTFRNHPASEKKEKKTWSKRS